MRRRRPGWALGRSVLRRQAQRPCHIAHSLALASGKPSERNAWPSQVLGQLQSCEAYDAFGSSDEGGVAYDTFRENLSNRGVALLPCLFDVFSGQHEEDMGTVCRNHNGPLGMIEW